MKTPVEFGNAIPPLTKSLSRSSWRRGFVMNQLTQSKNATMLPVLVALTLGCFALSPTVWAVDPPPDAGYPNQNTAEDEDALFSLTTGPDNTAMGLDALGSNASGSDNAPASRNWTRTGSLNTARQQHPATLLQNGMVLVAGGVGRNFVRSASAELYDPASGTWTATGSLNTARVGHTATLLQNGMVLVAGGTGTNNLGLAEAELGHGDR
jgi:Galactose oxidase, central domain